MEIGGECASKALAVCGPLVLVVALSEIQQQQQPLSLDFGSSVIPRVSRVYIDSLDTDALGLGSLCICFCCLAFAHYDVCYCAG